MKEEDLPGCVKLNNKFVDAVGKSSLKKMEYLFKTATFSSVVRDENKKVVAFMIAVA